MTILAGDILRTSINFLLDDGSLFQNVYHHRRIGPGLLITDAAHVAALETWAEAMYAQIDDHVSADVVEQLSTVDRVEWDGDSWEVTENIGTFLIDFLPVVAASQAMPNQVSAFITFKTARPQSVGRKFLFPLTESDFTSAVINPTAVTALVAFANDAVNDVEVDFPLDYLVPGVVRTEVDSFLDFTLALVTNLSGTQRRRRRGHGA